MSTVDKSKLATSDDELKALLASGADWIIHTVEDVIEYRNTTDSPLSKLSQGEFDKFLSLLTFDNGGVSGGSYRPLMASLTMNEIFDVFAKFGMAAQFALDNQESKCVNGDCVYEWGSFCSHITCHPQVKKSEPA